MYIVTGGAGFIGSAFVSFLNHQKINDIIVVDEAGAASRENLKDKKFLEYVNKETLVSRLKGNGFAADIKAIIHMGANSYTTERDMDLLRRNNYEYTRDLAEHSLKNNIRFIYASSASVYGDGAKGFSDNDAMTAEYLPLNPYGQSKQLFDIHAIREGWQKNIAGLRFFNVYGPNEYHKIGQFSVAYKAYTQVKEEGCIKLFKSYRDGYGDGEQRRDFVYVKDCCEVMWWLINNPNANGILNIGYGKARSWNNLAHSVFNALNVPTKIEYVEMPLELRDHYQYFTEANISRLRSLGYANAMTSLEDGVHDYVQRYLEKNDQYY